MTQPTHKAVSGPDEHEDQPGQTLVTRNHETIRAWAADRDGVPTMSEQLDGGGSRPVDLALELPDTEPAAGYERVSWERWLQAFDRYDMRFEFREHEADGSMSTSWSLDTSGRAEG
ncbi:hypothetical protein E1212_07590 [Jiangella ureilytica]|uniref:Uncharacterized protein n=1 Tax=Jiangella ureilytica TaxID=2530374 RepID=A0A4R4RTM1_9ACTN|nr:hypothetical protein [Jiangella ureilytica]TDC52994.1 hypothetical protein E1212_07590 [Jiangella ureilytica]